LIAKIANAKKAKSKRKTVGVTSSSSPQSRQDDGLPLKGEADPTDAFKMASSRHRFSARDHGAAGQRFQPHR